MNSLIAATGGIVASGVGINTFWELFLKAVVVIKYLPKAG